MRKWNFIVFSGNNSCINNSPQGKLINFYWPHINDSKLIKFLFPMKRPLLSAYEFLRKTTINYALKTYKIRGNRKIWLNSVGFYDKFENHQNEQHKAQQIQLCWYLLGHGGNHARAWIISAFYSTQHYLALTGKRENTKK